MISYIKQLSRILFLIHYNLSYRLYEKSYRGLLTALEFLAELIEMFGAPYAGSHVEYMHLECLPV